MMPPTARGAPSSHAGSAGVAVFFLRQKKNGGFPRRFLLPCRRKACRQSRATKGVKRGFGTLFAPL